MDDKTKQTSSTGTINPDEIDSEPSAEDRVKAVGIIHRFGSRAQKRAVAAGRGTKNLASAGWGGLKRQITEPYSALKMCGVTAVMALMIAGSFLWAFYVTLFVLTASGSILLAVATALIGAVMYQLVIAGPISRMAAEYASNAQLHKMGMIAAGPSAGFGFGGLGGFPQGV
jgi:hypothetical protein